MILGVQIKDDPLESIFKFVGTALSLMVGLTILSELNKTMKRPTKNDLFIRLRSLETRLITMTLEVNDDIIRA